MQRAKAVDLMFVRDGKAKIRRSVPSALMFILLLNKCAYIHKMDDKFNYMIFTCQSIPYKISIDSSCVMYMLFIIT
jgi:hypothetical protein